MRCVKLLYKFTFKRSQKRLLKALYIYKKKRSIYIKCKIERATSTTNSSNSIKRIKVKTLTKVNY